MLAGDRSSIAVAAAAVNIARIELFRDRAALLDCSVFSIARGFCAVEPGMAKSFFAGDSAMAPAPRRSGKAKISHAIKNAVHAKI
jgi:hypothetical protein